MKKTKTFIFTVAFLGVFAVSNFIAVSGSCGEVSPSATNEEGNNKQINNSKNNNDPFGFFNRAVFKFNKIVDTIILKPAAKVYKAITPEVVRTGVHNVLSNLDEPVDAINYVLQGNAKEAGNSLTRFVINTTVGIAGVNDFAKEVGYENKDNDFGKTLAYWGAGEGPYIVLPLLGPSNVRDTVGIGADIFMNPLNYALNVNVDKDDRRVIKNVVLGTKTLDARSRSINTLDKIEKESIDFYSAMKTMYNQFRQKQIEDMFPEQNSKRSYDIDFE